MSVSSHEDGPLVIVVFGRTAKDAKDAKGMILGVLGVLAVRSRQIVPVGTELVIFVIARDG